MDSLGNRIKYLREKSNISQKAFANKIGVSNTVLSRYESGDRNPDYDTLQLIADFFDVSTDYLLGRTDTIALTPQEVNTHLSHKQQEVLNFLLERENLFFEDKPEDIIEALDQFEIYYEVWKKQQNKKTKD